jgi:hypothetical protein
MTWSFSISSPIHLTQMNKTSKVPRHMESANVEVPAPKVCDDELSSSVDSPPSFPSAESGSSVVSGPRPTGTDVDAVPFEDWVLLLVALLKAVVNGTVLTIDAVDVVESSELSAPAGVAKPIQIS